MRPYEGLLTAMVTPFRADGSVDEEKAVDIGRHLLSSGSHGLVVAGTTGEAATMTDEEHLALIALIARELGDEATVVGGTPGVGGHSPWAAEGGSVGGASAVRIGRPCLSYSTTGPVGCLGAVLAFGFMLALLGGLLGLLVWVFYNP